MLVEDFIIELKASLRAYERRHMIDEASIWRWVEIALKKFGGDLSIPKDVIVDVKRKVGKVPGDYYDLILAAKCEFEGYEVPEGKKVIPELQNTVMWKERTERSYRWCSCEECCKDECEKTIVEKFYINTREHKHEVRCYYKKPVLLKLAKPFMKDLCLSDTRNKIVKECPYEINIVNGNLFANFDGPVYLKYRAVPFDNDQEVFIPDTDFGGVLDYVENYVKMRLFEEWMYNGEVPNADKMFAIYAQQDPVKFATARTELKMAGLRLEDFYKPLKDRKRSTTAIYEVMTPPIDQIVKLI